MEEARILEGSAVHTGVSSNSADRPSKVSNIEKKTSALQIAGRKCGCEWEKPRDRAAVWTSEPRLLVGKQACGRNQQANPEQAKWKPWNLAMFFFVRKLILPFVNLVQMQPPVLTIFI